jgi:hypothetical protein
LTAPTLPTTGIDTLANWFIAIDITVKHSEMYAKVLLDKGIPTIKKFARILKMEGLAHFEFHKYDEQDILDALQEQGFLQPEECADLNTAEVVRIKAEKEEAVRIQAEKEEEAARIEAEKEEAARIQAEKEEAARINAEKEEAARIQAEKEEAAGIKAEKEEAARINNIEKRKAARIKAENDEVIRIKAMIKNAHPIRVSGTTNS